MDSVKNAYSVEQVAASMSLSKGFVRKEIKLGRLKATRFGRRVLILAVDLASYIERARGRQSPD